MPQSRTRYRRAAMRSKYRKPKHRRSGSVGWNVAIAAVLIVGIVAVVLTRGGSAGSPGTGAPHYADAATGAGGDHWHSYLAVDICGEWLGPAPAFEKPFDNPGLASNAGIHSHGDGLIHTHPWIPSEAGKNATLDKYLGYGGWSISADSIDLGGSNSAHEQWTGPASAPGKTKWSAGDTCPFGQYKGKKVQLTWAVDGVGKHGNPSDYRQKNGETIAVYLLPKGADQPFPSDACVAFANITDQSAAAVVSAHSPCLAAATPSTSTPASTTR